MDLTDEQWKVLKPLIGELHDEPMAGDGPGAAGRCGNGILWTLRTGAQWADLADRYPPCQTCHRRFQRWVRDATFEHILQALAQDLKERGKLDLSECFIDATFVVAKRGRMRGTAPLGAKV